MYYFHHTNLLGDMNNIGIFWDGPVPVVTNRQRNAVFVPETTCALTPAGQEEFIRTINPLRESRYYGIDMYTEAVILLQNLLKFQEV